ncbi:MAG: hypothetical protein AAB783_00005 [Patescibacteria group bacterium]
MKNSELTKGFGILERVIVIGISLLVMYLLITAYQKFIDQQRVNTATENAANLIQKARTLTLSSRGGTSGLFYRIQFNVASNYIELRDQNGNSIEKLDLALTPVFIDFPTTSQFKKQAECATAIPPALTFDMLHFERLTGDAKIYTPPATWDSICATNNNSIIFRLKKNPTGDPSRTIKIFNTGSIQIL